MSAVSSTSGLKMFNQYLEAQKEFSSSKKINENYYHVNVVAEAYNKGFSDGKSLGKEEFIENMIKSSVERFEEKANQVYIFIKNIISESTTNGFDVESFFLNIFEHNPRAIISVKNELLLNDEFVEFVYEKIHEIKTSFNKLFDSHLDIGLVGCENLNIDLLFEDGFQYNEEC